MEATFGPLVTAIIIVLALASGAAQYALLEGGIGLSGVGYGLFGMLWVLGRRDRRFQDAVDAQTVNIFVAWFFICVVATYLGLMNVGNVAHGAGAAAGALIGLAVAPGGGRRMLPAAVLALFVAASVVGATIARDRINLSPHLGDDEFQLGYDALEDEDYVAAEKWLLRATRLQPDNAIFWYDLALAQEALGKFKESSASFERAHRLDPHDEDFKQAYERSAPAVGNTPLPRVITTMPTKPSEPSSLE